MNIDKLSLFLTVAAAAFAVRAVEVSDVTAKQRWPWNNVVDVSFTVSDLPAGETYRACLTAQSASGGAAYGARTFLSDPVVSAGANRIAWDFGADHPELYDPEMKVAVSLVPYSEATPIYLKIDLSAGPNAAKYPYAYTTSAPAHVQGATGEPCQTTELWLRRIRRPEKALVYGYFKYSGNNSFYGSMTKDYYVGVFELTQRQYELVMGSNPSYFSNTVYAASRPVESVVASRDLFGKNAAIQLHPEAIQADSLFGRLRARTGLPLTLPSYMQSEWACRAGDYGGEYYRYKVDGVELAKNDCARYNENSNMASATGDSDLSAGTAAVGSYAPNMFGLYDTLGNVAELTCELLTDWNGRGYAPDLAVLREAAGDETLGTTAENPVTDYCGRDLSTTYYRTFGGAWNNGLTIWYDDTKFAESAEYKWKNGTLKHLGLRLSMNVE